MSIIFNRNFAIRSLGLATLAAFGLAMAAPAHAEYRHHRFYHHHHDRFHVGIGVGTYVAPPVVYGYQPGPVYAAPPVVYGSPGISLGFHFR